MKRKFGLIAFAAPLALLGALRRAAAAPITFVTALPVAKDQLVTRFQFNPSIGSRNEIGSSEQLYDLRFPEVLAWGPTSRWTLFFTSTPEWIERTGNKHGSKSSATASGFGDELIWLRWTAYRLDNLKWTLREAPIVGIYAPTGWYDKSNASGRLPQDMQNGAGQVAGYFADALTWKTLNQEMDWDFQYRFNGSASPGFTRGDEWRVDYSWQFRLWPWPFPEFGIPNYWYGVFETNAIWHDRSVVDGLYDDNTGGFVWYFDPGIYYLNLRWDAGVAAMIPIYQTQPGVQRIPINFGMLVYFEYYFHVPHFIPGL